MTSVEVQFTPGSSEKYYEAMGKSAPARPLLRITAKHDDAAGPLVAFGWDAHVLGQLVPVVFGLPVPEFLKIADALRQHHGADGRGQGHGGDIIVPRDVTVDLERDSERPSLPDNGG